MTLRSQSPEQKDRIEKAEKLFAENINFAYWIMQRYFYGLSKDEDVVQDALIGLWEACLAFDETRGFKFSAFATPCICNNIRMSFRKRKNEMFIVSLDAPVPDQDELVFGDLIEDPNSEIDLGAIDLFQFIDSLSDREREMVRLRLNGASQKEGGKAIGISQAQYSRVMKHIKLKYMGKGSLN